MITHYLQFVKQPGRTGEQPDTPKAFIALKNHKQIELNETDTHTVVSLECRSEKEIEEIADKIIAELNTIKQQAKQFFNSEYGKLEKKIHSSARC